MWKISFSHLELFEQTSEIWKLAWQRASVCGHGVPPPLPPELRLLQPDLLAGLPRRQLSLIPRGHRNLVSCGNWQLVFNASWYLIKYGQTTFSGNS